MHITEAPDDGSSEKKMSAEDTDDILLTRSLSKELGLDNGENRTE